jgi:hypothetical protein
MVNFSCKKKQEQKAHKEFWEGADTVAQVMTCLSSKHEALSSNFNIKKNWENEQAEHNRIFKVNYSVWYCDGKCMSAYIIKAQRLHNQEWTINYW